LNAPPAVLYVEDDDNDVFFMRRAWTKVDVPNPLHVVTDGEEALHYLSGDGPYANSVDYPMPSLILLDLKLPRVSGMDVLRWIRSQPALIGLRVIVFSSSKEWLDFKGAYALRIETYVAKPTSFHEWVAMVGALKVHWLKSR
jgi:CheY-like chemotaxis protein